MTARGIPIRPARLQDDIFQTGDENRSIVELISNALDAGPGDVRIDLRDGFYEVADTGSGMSAPVIATRLLIPKLSGKPDPSLQIGRFGIGFYTALRHLKRDGESVVVETKAEGENGYRLTFVFHQGETWFHSEEIEGAKTGTRIRVTSSEIREDRMKEEIHRYLRYLNPDRSLLVNGRKVNTTQLETVLESSFGEGKASLKKSSKGNGISVMVGDKIVVEQYVASGRVPPGEWVIALPQEVELSITRDLVQADQRLVDCLEGILAGTNDPDRLNLLVPLFESLEKRNPPKSLMTLLRKRTWEVIEGMLQRDPSLRVYPDQRDLGLSGSDHSIFVHPHLFHDGWWGRFDVPSEFQSGETVNGAGVGRPVRLVLADGLSRAIHYDPELGVVWLNRGVYMARPFFVLSALFMIRNLRFRIDWGRKIEQVGLETVCDPSPVSSGIRDLQRLMKDHRLDLSRLSLRKSGITYVELKWTDDGDYLVIENAQGQKGVMDLRGRMVLDWTDCTDINLHSHGSELFFEVEKGGKWGVLGRDGKEVLPFEYDKIYFHSHGSELLFWVQKGGKLGVLGPDKTWLFPLDDHFVRLMPEGDQISVVRHRHHDSTLEILPYSTLLKIARDKTLEGRLRGILERHLDPGSHLFAIENASEAVWDRFFQDDQLRPHLQRFSDPLIAGFADLHPELDPSPMIQAFGLIERFGLLCKSGQEGEFFRKIGEILHSRIDCAKLLGTLESGGRSHDAEAARLYLGLPGGILLEEAETGIAPLTSRPVRLVDAITKIRLNEEKSLALLQDVPAYGNEQDERELRHAIHHLNVSNPYAFVRELLQNILDLQKIPGRVKKNEAEIRSYLSNGRLVVSLLDHGGMTEEEFIGLLDPGEGEKRDQEGLLGGFGVGFYSTLAEANWVRVKTAVKGSSKILYAEFLVERDERGKIKDIRLRVEKGPNTERFQGTLIETERHADLPQLEGARLDTSIGDLTKYIPQGLVRIRYNGEVANQGRPDPLVVLEKGPLGHVELYDGLENRILLGNLPLTDLPDRFWEDIPPGVRKYYSRLQFYLNLDHRVVKTTPTRDRFREPEVVEPELAKILPGLLIQGFLKRVMERREDFCQLPEVYFNEAYELASVPVLGEDILEDAKRINGKRYGEVDYRKYAEGAEGERRLLKLLTLLKFLPVGKDGEKLSLLELHALYQGAIRGDERDKALLQGLKESGILPQAIIQRLQFAEGFDADEQMAAQLLKKRAMSGELTLGSQPVKMGELYDRTEIVDPPTRRYLDLLYQAALVLYQAAEPGGHLQIGLSTRERGLSAYAFSILKQRNHGRIYWGLNPRFERDVAELTVILNDTDKARGRLRFESFLSRIFVTVSHELTHVLTERPDAPNFTHDPKFYDDQMEILLTPPLPGDLGDRWFRELYVGPTIPTTDQTLQ